MTGDTFPKNLLPPQLMLNAGVQVEHYRIVKKLGMGGMGVVYLAYDMKLKRSAAIKFVINTGEHTALQRFFREIQLAVRLNHPNIVKIFHIGQFQEVPYFAMEYVAGQPLLEYVAQKQLALPDRLMLVGKVAVALDYAHHGEVIHRDIKPSNILVREDGEPILMDFGLAKTTRLDDRSLTRSGDVIGTPEYMSPEQARGLKRQVDAQSDVYGLGAVLYHLLTGSPPVQGDTLVEKICRIIEQTPVPPRAICPEIPEAVAAICRRAMEKEKSRRYRTAQELADDLDAYRQGRTPLATRCYRQRRLLRVASIAWVAIVVLAGGFFFGGPLMRLGSKDSAVTQGKPVTRTLSDLERHYDHGVTKLASSPQEAYIYLAQVEKSLAKTSAPTRVNPARLRDIKTRLPLLLFQSAFAAKDYEQVCRLGQEGQVVPAISQTIAFWWSLAYAQFQCNSLAEALLNLEKIETKLLGAAAQRPLSQEETAYLGQALYYQGLTHFHQRRFAQARQKLAQADKIAQGRHDAWLPSLRLHYCATLLENLERTFSAEEIATIQQYLPDAEKIRRLEATDNLPGLSLLYQETTARALLCRAMQLQGAEQATICRQVIALTTELLQKYDYNASWYYLRGKAGSMLGHEVRATQDFDLSTQLDSTSLAPVLAKIDLFWQGTSPYVFRNYMSTLATIFQGGNRSVHLFAAEFQQLQAEESRKFARLRGMPFTLEGFSDYCRLLEGAAVEIREIATTAIISMLPHSKTVEALQAKLAETPDAKWLTMLHQQVLRQEQAYQEQECRHYMAQVSWSSQVIQNQRFLSVRVAALKKVLQEERSSPLLKALAAKVLVNIPGQQLRQELIKTYLDAKTDLPSVLPEPGDERFQPFINKIVVWWALQTIGYDHFMFDQTLWRQLGPLFAASRRQLFCREAADDEFVQALLMQLLRLEHADPLPVWAWLWEHGSDRVKMASAERVVSPNLLPPTFQQRLLEFLSKAPFHPDPTIATIALSVMCRRMMIPDNRYQKYWLNTIAEFFIPGDRLAKMFTDLQQKDMQQQYAIVHFGRDLASLLLLTEQQRIIDIICPQIRTLWNHQDLMMRSQAIMASASLLDRQVFETYLLPDDIPILERSSTFIGAINSLNIAYQNPNAGWLLRTLLEKARNPRSDWRSQATVLYLLSLSKNSLFLNHIEKALSDPHPYTRFSAIVCLSRRDTVPAKIITRLEQMAEQDAAPFVRHVAQGLLLHCACGGNNLKLQEPLHASIKRDRQSGWQERRAAAAWGYAIPWESPTADTIGLAVGLSDRPETFAKLIFTKILRDCKRSAATSAAYTFRLEKIVELLEDLPEPSELRNYAHQLVGLYQQQGKIDQALVLANKLRERLGIEDLHFTALWSELLWQQGKTGEAENSLREMLAKLGQLQSVLYPSLRAGAPMIAFDQTLEYLDLMKRYDAFHAQIKRSQIKLAMVQQQPLTVAQLQEQYAMAPHSGDSLQLLCDYFCLRREYAAALRVSQRLQKLFPFEIAHYLIAARLHILQKDHQEALQVLAQGIRFDTSFQLEELAEYPELAPLREELQKIFPKNRPK